MKDFYCVYYIIKIGCERVNSDGCSYVTEEEDISDMDLSDVSDDEVEARWMDVYG